MNKTLLFTLLLANFFYANANTRMSAYRWRNDNGDETTATWKAPLNTPLTIYNLDAIRLRVTVDDNNAPTGNSVTYQSNIQFSTDALNWKNLSSPGSPFTYVGSAYVADGSVTTKQISVTNSNNFEGGLFVSSNTNPARTLPSGNNIFTEYEFSIKPNAFISITDVYYFRVLSANKFEDAVLRYCSTQVALVTSPQNLSTNAKVQDLTAVGDNLKWYNQAEGGTELDPVTTLVTGKYYVSQTVSCESERTEVQVNVGSLGVDDHDLDFNGGLKVYPNPSSNDFSVDSKSNGTMVLFDLSGKTIQSQKMNSGTTTLDLGNAPKGVYLLKVTNENNQSKTVKLIRN